MFVVIGRFTHTAYGPFGTDREAQRFIKLALGSSTRYYEVELLVTPFAATKGR